MMRLFRALPTAGLFAVTGLLASAATLEVGSGKTYTDIQTAIDAATEGEDTVLVYDGTYTLSTQLDLSRGIVVRSKNGAESTILCRMGVIGSATDCQRCVLMDNADAKLDGFTLTGGYNGNQTMTASEIGGVGVYVGSKGGTLANLIVSNNFGNCTIGAVCVDNATAAVITNCVITKNYASVGPQGSGFKSGHKCNAVGLYVKGCVTIVDTEISHNDSYAGNETHGIGVNVQNGNICFLRCKITDNVAQKKPAGASYSEGCGIDLKNSTAWTPKFINCLIAGNGSADYRAGGVYAAGPGMFVNCTIVGNESTVGGGVGVHASGLAFRNCLIQDNVVHGDTSAGAPDWLVDSGKSPTFDWCLCPEALTATDPAASNLTKRAVFVSGTYELQGGTAACDAGDVSGEIATLIGSKDLNGDSRIWGSAIDIGCYEYWTDAIEVSAEASETSVDRGDEVTLRALVTNPSGGALSYVWRLGATIVGTTSQITQKINNWGENVFRLTVTDSNDEDYEASVTVTAYARTVCVVAPTDPTHVPSLPYDTEQNAFTNIQEAIDYLPAGRVVRVYPGTYDITNQISLAKSLTVESVGGPAATVVTRKGSVKTRLLYLAAMDALVAGFTFSNGSLNVRHAEGSGGGIFISSDGGTVSNCAVTGCNIQSDMYIYGGGVRMQAGRLVDSIISGNTNYCTLANISDGALSNGGGVYVSGGLVERCRILGNFLKAPDAESKFASRFGGGVYLAGNSGLISSLVADNVAQGLGGGVFASDTQGVISNVTIAGNSAHSCGGMQYADAWKSHMSRQAVLCNTAVAGNSTDGGQFGMPTDGVTVTHCFGPEGELPCDLVNTNNVFGTNAKFKNPMYVPSATSPLVNAGAFAEWMLSARDLRGNPRVGERKKVTIGCYQVEPSGFTMFIR